mgnify:CR=1 FL=1
MSNLNSLKSKLISFDVRFDAGVAGATHAMVDLGPLLISLVLVRFFTVQRSGAPAIDSMSIPGSL